MKLSTRLWLPLLLSAVSLAHKLPVVDLGYQLHRASFFNKTGQFYEFTGIRYARAPTGDRRWREPVAPLVNRDEIHNGSKAHICPQTSPSWLQLVGDWVPNYLAGKDLGLTKKQLRKVNSTSKAHAPHDSMISEDCLFLDVLVPSKIFDGQDKDANCCKGAPVLVWIYGGGYTAGSTTSSGSIAGLIGRSLEKNREGIIYVAMNYRLGAFGWLGGPTMQGEEGTANAGLYDQRFALQWVQDNIHLFGGDPNRVTVMGESAGGGSVMHQITAFGGLKGPAEVPFQQAILQSPGFLPQVSNAALDAQLDRLFELTGTSSLKELRKLPSKKLIEASYRQIYQSQYSVFTYGPSVDGYFVPAMPGKLMLQGAFAKDINVMVGHNSNEGLIFTDPYVQTNKQFRNWMQSLIPTANSEVLDYITEELYPPKYGGNQNYTDIIGRSSKSNGEISFVCNTYFTDKAYHKKGYAYFFSVPPGTHGEDVPYTYYNNEGVNSEVVNTTVAIALQDYITTFAQNGVPTSPDVKGIPKFMMYGKDAQVQDLGLKSIAPTGDNAANPRCDWWQKVLYI